MCDRPPHKIECNLALTAVRHHGDDLLSGGHRCKGKPSPFTPVAAFCSHPTILQTLLRLRGGTIFGSGLPWFNVTIIPKGVHRRLGRAIMRATYSGRLIASCYRGLPIVCRCCNLCPKNKGRRERPARRRKFASHSPFAYRAARAGLSFILEFRPPFV
jgi:hypothetical protein